ncbi:transglutaminase family protein [Salinifilum ghardaiensis]
MNPRSWRLDTSLLAALAGAAAVLCASAAFAGVLADVSWVAPAFGTVLGVVLVGVLARALHWHPALVVLAQLVGLALLLSALFSDRALLGFVPTADSLGEFAELLGRAGEVVRTGTPPVPAERALRCLLCLSLGIVAVAVDAIVVAARSAAVAGLVLLCVFAIPSALSGDLLPWWTFALAAAGFSLLLTADPRQHHWRARERPGRVLRGLLGPAGLSAVAIAAVLGLLSGVVFTGVGTQGRFPVGGPNSTTRTEGIGLRPFTSLRGQLTQDDPTELFRVRGLPEGTYLRAMTLRNFDPRRGWSLAGLTRGVPAGPQLPTPEGTSITEGERARVRIQPVSYRDPWLPVFGTPTGVSGMGPGWRYDPAAGIVFTQRKQDSQAYTERMVLPAPSAEDLRNADGPVAVAPAYLDTRGIPRRAGDLARRITADAPTDFDRAVALNRFFTDSRNGFTYDESTGPASGTDGLSEFLFRNRRGYCEQYASAMAAMLRQVGIPSRVAVGFTPGTPNGEGERSITTQDAHAWVEAYFPGWGWQTFDPTPLDDGRTDVPQYLDQQPPPPPDGTPPSGEDSPPPEETGTPAPQDRPEPPQPDAAGGRGDAPAWPAVLASVLVLAAAACGVPAGVRRLRRERRRRDAAAGGAEAAGQAWREVEDAFADRGSVLGSSETARTAAARLAEQHGLDEPSRRALRQLVHVTEHAWYAPAGTPAVPQPAPDELRTAVDAVLDGLHRAAPLPWHRRLFPRSVLVGRRGLLPRR